MHSRCDTRREITRIGQCKIGKSGISVHLGGVVSIVAHGVVAASPYTANFACPLDSVSSPSGHYLLWTLFNRMVRDPVLMWATVGLVVLLAFVLMPSYERFRDANGIEVDIAPGAPPRPSWLIPVSESTGLYVGGQATGYEYKDWLAEKYTNIFGKPEPTASIDPRPTEQLLPLDTYEGKRIGENYLKREGYSRFVPSFRESFENGELPQSTTITALPPPTTVASDIPSGVRTLRSQSMPPLDMWGMREHLMNADDEKNMALSGLEYQAKTIAEKAEKCEAAKGPSATECKNYRKQSEGLLADIAKMKASQPAPVEGAHTSYGEAGSVRLAPSNGRSLAPVEGAHTSYGVNRTLPPPDFSKGGKNDLTDKYVLKSSLVPCSCPAQGMSCEQHAGSYPSSSVPGSMNEDDAIQKPFSIAFPGETNPVGFLNSFAAFSR